MAKTFEPKPGDVVQLKSGGPSLTVELVTPGDYANCVWFDGAACSREQFLLVTLKFADSSGT